MLYNKIKVNYIIINILEIIIERKFMTILTLTVQSSIGVFNMKFKRIKAVLTHYKLAVIITCYTILKLYNEITILS